MSSPNEQFYRTMQNSLLQFTWKFFYLFSAICSTNLFCSTELVFVSFSDSIVSVDTTNGLITNTIPIPNSFSAITISANGAIGAFVSGSPGDAYTFLPFSSAAAVRIYDGVTPFFGISPTIPRDGSTIYIVDVNTFFASSIDPVTSQIISPVVASDKDMQVSNNGRFLCITEAVSVGMTLSIYDIESGTTVAVENANSTPMEDNFAFYITPDDKIIYVIGFDALGPNIYVVDPITAKVKAEFTTPVALSRLCTNFDGSIIAAIDINENIWIISPTNAFPPRMISGTYSFIKYGMTGALALNSSGSTLYAHTDFQLYAIDTVTGALSILRDFGSDQIYSIAYYSDQPIYRLTATGSTNVAYDSYQSEYYNSLSWTVSNQPESYIIYRNGTQIATLSKDALTYEDHNLLSNTSYTYEIKAVFGNGIPATVTDLTITTQG